MVDNRFKIKVIGIVDYYKSQKNKNCEIKFDFQRNVFLENHGKLIKIKQTTNAEITNEKQEKNMAIREKQIQQIFFEEKEGYENYFLIGDLNSKTLLQTDIYSEHIKDNIILERLADSHMNDDRAMDIVFLYNEEFCLAYLDGKIIDMFCSNTAFKMCEKEEIFKDKEIDIEK